jgi:1-acyl-sn-glycerol-3-phosphate acyltransferase
MGIALRKLRLVIHLLRGMWIVARRFSRVSAAERAELNRVWSIEMLRRSGMKLVVHNDDARLDAGVLVVGNHISWIDIYVINAWRPTPFVSKAEIRKWPVVGWLAEKLDTVFVQREKRSDARRIMHELAQRLMKGDMMCVFPEGTTTDGTAILPFHANMFQAAVSASVPVQPICIMYEDASGKLSTAPAYIGDMTLNDSLNAVLRAEPLTAHLYVCNPLAPGADRRLLASEAQASVQAALDRMRGSPAVVVHASADPSIPPVTSSSHSSPA